MDEKKTVPSLPFSGREYITFSLLLAKLALEDQDKKLCDLYFDLEYRARIANKYEKPKELEELEKAVWELGTGEKVDIENSEKHKL